MYVIMDFIAKKPLFATPYLALAKVRSEAYAMEHGYTLFEWLDTVLYVAGQPIYAIYSVEADLGQPVA